MKFELPSQEKIIFFMKAFYAKQKKDGLAILAQSLTYNTLLSIVPLFILMFSILGFLVRDKERQEEIFLYISDYLFPEFVNEVVGQIDNLSRIAFQLGAVGIPVLFVLAIMMYLKVDSAINLIWQSKERREWRSNVIALFMAIFIGPFLLVMLFSLPTYLQAIPYADVLQHNPIFGFISTTLMPLGIMTGVFFIIFSYVPLGKVDWRYALLSAFFTSILITLNNFVLKIYFTNFSYLGLIYSSLSILPIFLMWVYLMWFSILIGSSLNFLLQNFSSLIIREESKDEMNQSIINFALILLIQLTDDLYREEQASSLKSLEEKLRIPFLHLKKVLNRLIEQKWIIEYFDSSTNGKGQADKAETFYQLSLSPTKITLKMLTDLFYIPLDAGMADQEVNEKLKKLQLHPGFLEEISIDALYHNDLKSVEKIEHYKSAEMVSKQSDEPSSVSVTENTESQNNSEESESQKNLDEGAFR